MYSAHQTWLAVIPVAGEGSFVTFDPVGPAAGQRVPFENQPPIAGEMGGDQRFVHTPGMVALGANPLLEDPVV